MDQHVWVLMTGDYVDPSTILSVHGTPESGRAAFTPTALTLLINDRHATLAEQPDGALTVHGGGDFLSLTPFPAHTAQDAAPPTVTYRGEQHEVLWLGADHGEALLEIRPLGGSGGTQTVRISDLDPAD